MGLISDFLSMFFGSGRNMIVETAEVFRENAESGRLSTQGSPNSAGTRSRLFLCRIRVRGAATRLRSNSSAR